MEIKKGQVWIETVLYTLIGLALIALVLAFVMPKLNAQKDKMTVDQTISSLNDFDERINAVLTSAGNVRTISLSMKRGTFSINSTVDSIQFYFDDLTAPYSEPGVPVQIGRVSVLSEKKQRGASVLLTLSYAENITYKEEDVDKLFTAAATPYKFSIENLGVLNSASGRNVISISEQSS